MTSAPRSACPRLIFRPAIRFATRLAALILVLGGTHAGAAAAQNLILNGDFNSDLSHWTSFDASGAAVAWAPDDANGAPGSGSVRAFNQLNIASSVVALAQCVPVAGGVDYELDADAFIPSGQATSGSAAVWVQWQLDATCTTPGFFDSPVVANQVGGWVHGQSSITAPTNAAAARVTVEVAKSTDNDEFVAQFDNVSLAPISTGNCIATSEALCLNQGRFRVSALWQRSNGTTGQGQVVKLTDDTGYFWFFNAENVEMVVKVLNGCPSTFNSYWVFAGGLTNVEVEMVVTDTEHDEVRTYTNPLRTPFQPLQDTEAFLTCP